MGSRKVGSRKVAGWLLYDDGCGICRAGVLRWAGALRRRGFDVAPLQSPWVRQRVGETPDLLTDVRLLLDDGRQLRGADVYRHLTRRFWWAWPIYLLSVTPGVRLLFDRAYRAFADNRHHLSRSCRLPGEI